MPNWTFNSITFQNPNTVRSLLNEKGEFDFNTLIPMPESLHMDEGSSTDLSIYLYLTDNQSFPLTQEMEKEYHLHFWSDPADKLSYFSDAEKETMYRLGKQYVENIEKYGHATWYGWANEHWGTKWNACEPTVGIDNCTIDFNTAWCEPTPIFEEICRRFPDEEITFSCDYEEGLLTESHNDHGTLVLDFEKERTWNEDEMDWEEF